MFIQTEQTPNPNALKFILGFTISNNVHDFESEESATYSQLAKNLFDQESVERVYVGKDFVTVTKQEDANWADMKPIIISEITNFIMSGRQIIDEAKFNSESAAKSPSRRQYTDEEESVVKQIVELIDERVRPAVAMDGGDIVFEEFVDGIVKLRLKGSCSGCPSSTITLKNGIENMLKHYVPEVLSVESIDG